MIPSCETEIKATFQVALERYITPRSSHRPEGMSAYKYFEPLDSTRFRRWRLAVLCLPVCDDEFPHHQLLIKPLGLKSKPKN